MRAVIVKSAQASGFGDLLKSAITGVAYAILSHRSLYIDWSGNIYNYGFDKNLFYDLFELRDVQQLDCIPSDDADIYPPTWRGSLNKSFSQLWAAHGDLPWNRAEAIKKYSFDLSHTDYKESILVMWEFDQFPLVRRRMPDRLPQTGSDFQAMAAVFSRHVKLKDSLRRRIDSEWNRISGGQDVLGVHVRMTNESIRARGAISLEKYIDCARDALKKSGLSRIFLATDNELAQKRFASEFPGTVYVVDKWFGAPGEALHLNNESCPDAWQNIMGAISDIFLLARCKKIVCQTNSSFSQIALIVGNIDPDGVVDVYSNKKRPIAMRILGRAKRFIGQRLQIGGG